MCAKFSLSPFKKWLKSVIIPVTPGMIMPGRWVMYEYYSEPDDELMHITEEELLREKLYWEIEFDQGGIFRQKSNIAVKFLEHEKDLSWNISRNYLDIESKARRERFQFALVKDHIRLLQKERTGRIVFFGFFKKLPV